MSKSKAVLIILDGVGHTEKKEHNALEIARTPNLDEWMKRFPNSLLETSGPAVGLPEGIMGNSEVGHLCIGSGRIIRQDITRINDFAEEQGFESLEDVRRVLTNPKGTLHLLGLVSDGGVHSDIEHLFKLIEASARVASRKNICIHVITDGRDTPPNSGTKYVAALENKISKYSNIRIGTVLGRFFIMDRDKRWERVEAAYKSLTEAPEKTYKTASEAVSDAYRAGETDEFISPRKIEGGSLFQANDQAIFFNFRADRAREISMAFATPGFKEFATPVKIEAKNWVTFTRYSEEFPFPILFSPQKHTRLLGELVSEKGDAQLRIAETEKYAHVTYFFNGGEEEPFRGEDRVLIPSPKEVKTYDLKPEMSALAVTDEVLKRLNEKDYRLIVINYANGDMVGHTGNETAAVKAMETIDGCLGRVVKLAVEKGYDVLITADHGNVEEMVDLKTGVPFTQHTTNPVPLIWVGPNSKQSELKNGVLADIAPTILHLFGWEQPKEMRGHSLVIDRKVLMKC